jgi:hypothetical protein
MESEKNVASPQGLASKLASERSDIVAPPGFSFSSVSGFRFAPHAESHLAETVLPDE